MVSEKDVKSRHVTGIYNKYPNFVGNEDYMYVEYEICGSEVEINYGAATMMK
jgi:hypothetical protein